MANCDSEFFGLVFPGFQATPKIHAQNSRPELSAFLSNFTFSDPKFIHGDFLLMGKTERERERETPDCPGFPVPGAATAPASRFYLGNSDCVPELTFVSWPLGHLLGPAAHNSPTTSSKTGCTTQFLITHGRIHTRTPKIGRKLPTMNTAEKDKEETKQKQGKWGWGN